MTSLCIETSATSGWVGALIELLLVFARVGAAVGEVVGAEVGAKVELVELVVR